MSDLPWEDNLLERKLESDLKDLLKTLVAFANSVRPGHIAVILIGETDDGIVQGVTNPDNIQKTVREKCDKIYPPILWRSLAYEREGKVCVRVEVEYDGETPHFGDAAWVRRGSVTEKASDEVFQRLIDYRQSKVRELAKFMNKEVTVTPDLQIPDEIDFNRKSHLIREHPRWGTSPGMAVVRFVNSFWITLETESGIKSEPLEKIVLSWDNKRERLRLLVRV